MSNYWIKKAEMPMDRVGVRRVFMVIEKDINNYIEENHEAYLKDLFWHLQKKMDGYHGRRAFYDWKLTKDKSNLVVEIQKLKDSNWCKMVFNAEFKLIWTKEVYSIRPCL